MNPPIIFTFDILLQAITVAKKQRKKKMSTPAMCIDPSTQVCSNAKQYQSILKFIYDVSHDFRCRRSARAGGAEEKGLFQKLLEEIQALFSRTVKECILLNYIKLSNASSNSNGLYRFLCTFQLPI